MSNLQLNVDFKQLLDVVKQLSPLEKLQLNEFIWNDNFEIPIEHQKIVLDRINKSTEDSNRLLDWDEASILLNSK